MEQVLEDWQGNNVTLWLTSGRAMSGELGGLDTMASQQTVSITTPDVIRWVRVDAIAAIEWDDSSVR